jgi:sugar transferase (PEP-CTERM/EpsH1 system associated)
MASAVSNVPCASADRPRAAQSAPTICQVLHGLEIGGAEVLAARLARRLGRSFRFRFVCLDEVGTLGRALADEEFGVWLLNRKSGLDAGCAWRLARLVSRERVDLLHVHQYTPFVYAMLARLVGRRRPVMFTEHGRFHPDYRRPKRVAFNRLMLRSTDRVVAVGEAVRQALVANEGIPRDRIEVIYNGIDLETFESRGDDGAAVHDVRSAVRREIGAGPHEFLVLQVARLDYLKDYPTAVRTIARLADASPTVKLAIVGEGPERQRIESEIRRCGVEGRVRLLGRRQDVPRLLAAADALLLTSISEGIPLTVIEAMAAGLPVVSTDVGGVPEIVEEGATGLLVPSANDEQLAERLLRLARDPGLCRDLGARGRARARQQFSEEQMHSAYVRLYEEMLRG